MEKCNFDKPKEEDKKPNDNDSKSCDRLECFPPDPDLIGPDNKEDVIRDTEDSFQVSVSTFGYNRKEIDVYVQDYQLHVIGGAAIERCYGPQITRANCQDICCEQVTVVDICDPEATKLVTASCINQPQVTSDPCCNPVTETVSCIEDDPPKSSEMILGVCDPQLIFDIRNPQLVSATCDPELTNCKSDPELISNASDPQLTSTISDLKLIFDISDPQLIFNTRDPELTSDVDDQEWASDTDDPGLVSDVDDQDLTSDHCLTQIENHMASLVTCECQGAQQPTRCNSCCDPRVQKRSAELCCANKKNSCHDVCLPRMEKCFQLPHNCIASAMRVEFTVDLVTITIPKSTRKPGQPATEIVRQSGYDLPTVKLPDLDDDQKWCTD